MILILHLKSRVKLTRAGPIVSTDSCRGALFFGSIRCISVQEMNTPRHWTFFSLVLAFGLAVSASGGTNSFYIGNCAPLEPSRFIKLPIGSIKPKGWLRRQLELEADGMTGHLEEISKWLNFDKSAWASRDGSGEFGFEELPYWLKGYGDLGYVLHDDKIKAHAKRWIDAVFDSQRPDGWFGPRSNLTSLEGQVDLWPNMVMMNVLQSFYEATGDPRVLPFLTKYFHWLNTLPPPAFGRGYWPPRRAGDMIETAYWLYNRTGDAFLLDVARNIHDNMANWTSGVIDWHNVNVAEGFREPGVYFLQARDEKYLDAAENNYQTIMRRYGQFAGGGFAADENARPDHTGPQQGFETCGIVEFMHSFEMLTKISGDPAWADRCEYIAFNSLTAALTPDLKGLHYLTCPNQVLLDAASHAPGIQNGGTMFSYSAGEVYRCCQHNVSHGWPYYAEELWLATPDNGLCLSLYAPSRVSAKVGDGANVVIDEATGYPFDGGVKLVVALDKPASFPLDLRIPGWCARPKLIVNHKKIPATTGPGSYAVVQRQWKNGDVVTLELPMTVTLKTWPSQGGAVSINRGPLSFSLDVGEKWTRIGGSDAWPDWAVMPTTPWNYGLLTNEPVVVKKPHGLSEDNPFTPENTPIELRLRAKRIPGWRMDEHGLAANPPASPVKINQPAETVTLIPMGAARLRISMFPVAQ